MASKKFSLKELPYILEPFIATKIDTQLFWEKIPNNKFSSIMKDECSYLINGNSLTDLSKFNPFEEKIFFAERYGGEGIGKHGGGARCGFDGNWQIKGIGANQLVGEGSKFTNGELTLEGAMLEILWGELLSIILPHGAVNNHAILLTDLNSVKLDSDNQILKKRALLIREPVIRPAHFCRAYYFNAIKHENNNLNEFKILIKALVYHLSIGEVNIAKAGILDICEENVSNNLLLLTKRLATQIAFCHSRHLVLFTSPSNCALDGRLLDFHGVRCIFPDKYRSNKENYLQFKKIREEPYYLLNGIIDLSFFISKYYFGNEFRIFMENSIYHTFIETYNATKLRENLYISGFNPKIINDKVTLKYGSPIDSFLQDILDSNFDNKIFIDTLNHSTDSHPGIFLLNLLIDEFFTNDNILKSLPKKIDNNRISFYEFLEQYSILIREKNLDLKNEINTMKEKINIRLSNRKFMNRMFILEKLQEISNNNQDLKESFASYQSEFQKKALGLLL